MRPRAIPALYPGLLGEQVFEGEDEIELLGGIARRRLENTRNKESLLLLESDRLADDIVGPVEKLCGELVRDDDGILIFQQVGRLAIDQGKRENIEIVLTGILPGGLEILVPYRKRIFRPPAGRCQRCGILHLRDLRDQEIGHQPRGFIGHLLLAIDPVAFHHLVDAVVVRKELIEAELVGHPEPDEQGATDTGGKTQEIEYGELAVFEEAPPGDLKVVL